MAGAALLPTSDPASAADAGSTLVISTYDTSSPVSTLTDAVQAANSGITILSSNFVGISGQSATYKGFNLPSATAGQPSVTVPDGVLLTTGSADLPLSNTTTAFSHTTGTGSNALLSAAAGVATNDQNVLTLNFTVQNAAQNAVSARFVYGTDEYPEYESFTDTFGFFVDGKNYAVFPDGSLVSIQGKTAGFFNDNTKNSYGLEYDGISNQLTVSGALDPTLTVHTLTIAVADALDTAVDSGAFIGGLQAGLLTGKGGITSPSSLSIDTTHGDLAANQFSLGSAAAEASTLVFNGGTLQVTGGAMAGDVVTAPVTISATNGTVDTTNSNGGFSGVVSGPGSLTVTGSRTFTLSGANTYAGGTVLNGGTLAVGNSSALGTGTLTFGGGALQAAVDGLALGNAATLAVGGTIDTQGFGLTYAGTIAGAGQLTKTGTGTLTLAGQNTYAGGTVLSAGTTVITNSAMSGTVPVASSIGTGTLTFNGGTLQNGSTQAGGLALANPVAVTAAGGTIDANGNGLDFLGAIAGGPDAGTLRFVNTGGGAAGVSTLHQSSSFAGGALVGSGASVILDADNAAGTGPLEIEGSLDLGTSSQSTTRLTGQGLITGSTGHGPGTSAVSLLSVGSGAFGGTIQDGAPQAVALVKVTDGSAAGGTLALSGHNVYTGPTSVLSGTLQAGSATGFSPNSAFTVAAGAVLDTSGFTVTTGSLSGAGTVTNGGAAAATLATGYTNASASFDGVLADGTSPLALSKTGTGTQVLTGASTYSGGTALLAGTLAIGSDAALGTGPLAMDDGTTLQFAADQLTLGNAIQLTGLQDPTLDTGGGTETLSGPITGTGALTKAGTGTLDLTGTDTYTGATTVAAGTLLVDGSLVNSIVTVDGGAALGGHGSVAGFVAGNGAIVSPGGPASLTVTGNATFSPGATYQVTVNPDGTNGKLAIGGTAALNAASLSILAGSGTFSAGSYTLLTAAGGVSGTFGTVTTASTLALLDPQVSYTADDVVLTLHPVAFATLAATANQAATASAIQSLGPTSPLYDAVAQQTQAGAQRAFAAASGVTHASTTSIIETNTRLSTGLVIDRLWDVSGNGLSAQQVLDKFAPDQLPALVRCYGPVPDPAPAPRPPSYTAWGEGFGSFGHTDAGPNAGALDRSLGGFVAGIDTPLSGVLGDAWRGGVAGGYTHTVFRSHLDGGSGTVEGVFGSLYGGARYGSVDVRLGTTVGGNFVDARRTVAFPGFFETERSSNDGYSLQTFGEAGYRVPTAVGVIEPVAGAAFLHTHQNGFDERGGAAALRVSALDNDLGTTTLGFRGEVQPFGSLPVVAHGFLAWQHVIGNVSPATTLAFEAAGSGSFSVTGTPIDRDALAAELALDYRVSVAFDVGLSYSGLVGPTATDHSVKGRAEYRF